MPSSLDPIFPLPAGTGIPPVKEGTGRDLLQNDVMVTAGTTYRAFYLMWEQVERIAAVNYPKYVDGPMHHVAAAHLEAVKWCREVGHPLVGELPVLSEKEAQELRAQELLKEKKAAKKKSKVSPSTDDTPSECPKCGPHRTVLKKKFKGEKVWKCADCGHRWPRTSEKSVRSSGSVKAKASGKASSNGGKSSRKRAART